MDFSQIKSVLLVDDDDTTNFLNKVFIKQHFPDLEVNIVKNGKEALSFIALNKTVISPAIVLLDTMMPVMDGWEFANTFDQTFDQDFKKDFVVVMLTASYSEEMAELIKSYPAIQHVIPKPLSDLKFRIFIEKNL